MNLVWQWWGRRDTMAEWIWRRRSNSNIPISHGYGLSPVVRPSHTHPLVLGWGISFLPKCTPTPRPSSRPLKTTKSWSAPPAASSPVDVAVVPVIIVDSPAYPWSYDGASCRTCNNMHCMLITRIAPPTAQISRYDAAVCPFHC
jgi:hypothetical protein